jgi:hypothetical protein
MPQVVQTPTPVAHYGQRGKYVWFEDEPLPWVRREGKYVKLDDAYEQVDRVGKYVRITFGL